MTAADREIIMDAIYARLSDLHRLAGECRDIPAASAALLSEAKRVGEVLDRLPTEEECRP